MSTDLFKEFQKRIIVSTDLFGRNIVINYDMPGDSDSYLHRITLYIQTKMAEYTEELWDLMLKPNTHIYGLKGMEAGIVKSMKCYQVLSMPLASL